jgi:hypothetical protein
MTVFLDVVGRASSRWRGAKSPSEAAEKNMELSIGRAEAVTTVIQSKLQKDLPRSVDIVVVGNKAVTPSKSKIPIRSQGKGSKSPIIVGYGFGKSPSGYRLKGTTKAVDKNPGDFIDGYIYSDQTKRLPGVQKTDSRIVTFQTGEWKLTEGKRLYLEKWARDWADKIRVINQI